MYQLIFQLLGKRFSYKSIDFASSLKGASNVMQIGFLPPPPFFLIDKVRAFCNNTNPEKDLNPWFTGRYHI